MSICYYAEKENAKNQNKISLHFINTGKSLSRRRQIVHQLVIKWSSVTKLDSLTSWTRAYDFHLSYYKLVA